LVGGPRGLDDAEYWAALGRVAAVRETLSRLVPAAAVLVAAHRRRMMEAAHHVVRIEEGRASASVQRLSRAAGGSAAPVRTGR
jgi:ABC-type transport system involved in cytochrome bd biosynthesis fused ATPase/permease subunit